MNDAADKNYGDTLNPTVVSLIEDGPHRVLDVGCAQGFQLEHLKRMGKAAYTVGVERVAEACRVAASRADRVICADVTELDLSEYRGAFDYIVYADILEHLANPWPLVQRHKELLSGTGRMVLCIPNVRNIVLIHLLARGDWTYTRFGLLDESHLRFFTRASILDALHGVGLVVEREAAIVGDERFYRATMRGGPLLDEALALEAALREKVLTGQDCRDDMASVLGSTPFGRRDVEDLLTVQHVFRVRPIPA